MKRSVVALAALAVGVAPLTVSCGADSTETGDPAPLSSEQPPPPKPPAHLGQTLNLNPIGGGKMDVALVAVIDPAVVSVGADPAKSYIATKLTLTNTGTTTVTGDANNNVKVTGSDKKDYAADVAEVNGCSNFVYGEFILAPGESTTGCVVFALPAGVTAAKVRYLPSSGISRNVGEWLPN